MKSDVEALESFLLKASVSSPGSMSRIAEMILNLDYDTKAVSKQRISGRFTELSFRALENGNTYEAIWLLYTLRGLKCVLADKQLVDLISSSNSSVLALMLLDMKARGLVRCPISTSYWESQITDDAVKVDWSWLLAYEGMRRGWLPDPNGLMAQPFFAAMHSRGVIFYDERRNVRKRREMLRLRKAMQRRMRSEVRRFMFTMRDVEFDEHY